MNRLSYDQKFELLDQKLRWEVANEIRDANLAKVDELQSLVTPRDGLYVRYGKRMIDVSVSALALMVSLPVNLVVFFLTLIDLGWPIVFTQRRLGKGGREFVIVKLRTMRTANDAAGRPLLGEHRVTSLGRLIRRASLDELLNFWNILKGDMSLIGPRPLVPEYLDRYSRRHRQRLAVKPGLECPTPQRLDRPMTYGDQFENDCWYVSQVSLRTDMRLIWRVVQTAMDRRQNASRGSSSRGSFMGYDERGVIVTTKNLPEWALDTVLSRHGLLPAEDEINDAK